MNWVEFLSVARGDSRADLLFRHARIVNVFSGTVETADVAVKDGLIAGVGTGYSAQNEIDLKGAYLSPGLIDAHVHIESSLCIPSQFAAAVLPRGVTTVITDPHEIANVAGAAGIRFMADNRAGVPLRIEIMAPSCVPATPMGTSGATLDANDLAKLLDDKIVSGLAEVMNFPGVINGDSSVLDKIAAFQNTPIDGHCPNTVGRALSAYVGAGVLSDHECVSVEEAAEKLARGLYIFIREATNAHNLDALLPLITPSNSRRICFCTDDRQPADLLSEGGIDAMVRRAVAKGIDPVEAIRLATLNPAEYFGLKNRGAIAPGKVADFFIFDDLRNPIARETYVAGENVRDYRPPPCTLPSTVTNTVRVDFAKVDFRIKAEGKQIRVIGSLPDQLITEARVLPGKIQAGYAVADASRDILKIAVIERHHHTGNIGLGFIQGFGLKRGAIAGTVAHDHHNLVVIGADDISMQTAAKAAASGGGGLCIADGAKVLGCLPLPVAGLMSDQPIAQVREAYQSLLSHAANLGSSMHDPFMAMSFMALEVIPSLKLTDQGLVDVTRFEKVKLFVQESS